MKKAFIFVMLIFALSILSTSPVLAKGWYVGGGIQSVAFGDDLEDIDNGSGLVLSFGYRFSSFFYLDFLMGSSSHDENLLGGDATHGDFLMGAKFAFNDPNTFQPYITFGLSGHSLEFDHFQDIDGSGLFLGFGADIFFTPNHSLDLGLRSSTWDGEDRNYKYDVKTGIFSIVYNYHFVSSP